MKQILILFGVIAVLVFGSMIASDAPAQQTIGSSQSAFLAFIFQPPLPTLSPAEEARRLAPVRACLAREGMTYSGRTATCRAIRYGDLATSFDDLPSNDELVFIAVCLGALYFCIRRAESYVRQSSKSDSGGSTEYTINLPER